uniref:Uncharacterized protein n=1 Tax=Dulem virus 42 TaxID=3145760 RepID=A0AAU8B7U7_9CAUD
MMYRIDVYKKNKKAASHWYQTEEQAANAKKAISGMREKKYTLVPGEHRPQKTVVLGGWTVSKIVKDNKY